jgi:hypothetical protein
MTLGAKTKAAYLQNIEVSRSPRLLNTQSDVLSVDVREVCEGFFLDTLTDDTSISPLPVVEMGISSGLI